MEEGTVSRWLKRDGDPVQPGEEIVEIDTDKATMGYAADTEGFLSILVGEGGTVAVGEPIAEIAASPDAVAASTRSAEGNGVSPVARKLAAQLGVDLSAVTGSGVGGRILKDDVRKHAADRSALAPPSAPSHPTGDHHETVSARETARREASVPRRRGFTRREQIVADRMVQAKNTIPEFYAESDVDLTDALALRAQLREQGQLEVTVNDLLVRATALALLEHPRLNATCRDNEIEFHSDINIGIAVAVDDDLLVPTVREASELSLKRTAEEVRRLISRAREGKLAASDMEGATFTMSNLGMLGVARFAAIMRVPQVAILTIGTIKRIPRFDNDGLVVPRDLATLGLISDHRVVYGSHAAQFLQSLRQRLENPLSLLL